MILTDLTHLEQYAALGPAIARGLCWLAETKLSELEPGRHEIDGDRLYCNCFIYETRTSKPLYEAHRDYIDIQVVVSGHERMGYAPLDHLNETQPYAKEGDCVLGHIQDVHTTFMNAPAGTVAIFFPEDAHAPGLAFEISTPVKKCVIKVRIQD
jgi:YhcH/YjgK/YiaL family protein